MPAPVLICKRLFYMLAAPKVTSVFARLVFSFCLRADCWSQSCYPPEFLGILWPEKVQGQRSQPRPRAVKTLLLTNLNSCGESQLMRLTVWSIHLRVHSIKGSKVNRRKSKVLILTMKLLLVQFLGVKVHCQLDVWCRFLFHRDKWIPLLIFIMEKYGEMES